MGGKIREWCRANMKSVKAGKIKIKLLVFALRQGKTVKMVKRDEINQRAEIVREMVGSGLSQSYVADEFGVSKKTIQRYMDRNTVRAEEVSTPKRKVIRYEISQYTQPDVAAAKIIEKFGKEFALRLGKLLCELSEH